MKQLLSAGLYLSFLLTVGFHGGEIHAQPPDLSDLMSERKPDCYDIRFNSMRLIPDYFERESLDSVEVVLDYWEYHCGASQASSRARILLDMSLDSLPISDVYLADIMLYPDYVGFGSHVYFPFGHRGHFPGSAGRENAYFNYLQELAEIQAARTDLPRFEHLLALHLAGSSDSLLTAFRREEFPERPAQSHYLSELDRARSLPETHYAIFGGAWFPTDSLSILGVHPELGMILGFQGSNFVVDFGLVFRFVKTPENYRFVEGDSTYVTDHFFGITVGGDFGYRLLKTPRNEIQIVGGIAYDNFTVEPGDEEADIDAVSAGALNLNFGINHRFYFKGDTYFGLRARYNVLNYNSHGGSDLSGNAFSLGLSFGFAGNNYKRDRLSRLGVRGR